MPAGSYLIRPNGELFILEVVTNLNKSMPTTVTSHPIETGSSVSDHVILQNKTWTLDCLISDATFNFLDNKGKNVVSSDAVVQFNSIVNKQYPSVFVSTNRLDVGTGLGERQSLTSRLVSAAGAQLGFLTQFFKSPIKVKVDITGNVPTPPGKDGVKVTTSDFVPKAEAARQLLEEIRDKREVLTLVHTSGTYKNLIITNVEHKRDASTSFLSYVFTLSLEQIQVVERARTVEVAKRKPKPKPAPKPAAAKADTCAPKAEAGKASGSQTPAAEVPTPSNPSFLTSLLN